MFSNIFADFYYCKQVCFLVCLQTMCVKMFAGSSVYQDVYRFDAEPMVGAATTMSPGRVAGMNLVEAARRAVPAPA